jgi:hypothetical protein
VQEADPRPAVHVGGGSRVNVLWLREIGYGATDKVSEAGQGGPPLSVSHRPFPLKDLPFSVLEQVRAPDLQISP